MRRSCSVLQRPLYAECATITSLFLMILIAKILTKADDLYQSHRHCELRLDTWLLRAS